LDACVVKCIVFGYPKCVQGYHPWYLKLGFKKCIVNQDIYSIKLIGLKSKNFRMWVWE